MWGRTVMHQEIEVSFDDLLLDHENPRLGSVENQTDALRELVRLSSRNFVNMMKSISENGLDPGDLFYLVDESDETGIEGFTVIDGNRRIAALKVLLQPSLIEGIEVPDKIEKRLRKATEAFDKSKLGNSRTCILFDNRGDAEDWILRRHGRNLEGEERIAWGPLEIQRFQGDRSILDILDFVERNGNYSSDQWATLRAKLDRSSYVLRRFLESKAGRETLGLGNIKEDGKQLPTTKRNPNYLVKILSKILDEIAGGEIDTRKFNKASEIQDYFDDLEDDFVPDDAQNIKEAAKFAELDVPKPKPSPPTPPPPPPRNPVPRLRTTLAPKQLEFRQPTNAKGRQFLIEASKASLQSAPLTCAFLLRGFIQFVVDTYMLDNSLPFQEGAKQLDLSVRAERVYDHLISTTRAKSASLNGVRRRLSQKSKNDPSSLQALNDYHHDQYQVPGANDLRTGWDDATALFVAVLGRVTK